jgi:hypothetical protein
MAPILLDRSIAADPLYPHDSLKSQNFREVPCGFTAPDKVIASGRVAGPVKVVARVKRGEILTGEAGIEAKGPKKDPTFMPV